MRKHLKSLDKIVIIIGLCLFLFLRPDIVVILLFILLPFYLWLTKRKILFYHLLVSITVSLFWAVLAQHNYSYNIKMISIIGINLFPFLAWGLGMLGVYMVYSHYEHKLKTQTVLKKLALFTAFYWPMLLIAETLGRHVFGIKNMGDLYSGLPICNCMHGPWWLKVAYFSLGIIFFITCVILKLENPHKEEHGQTSQNKRKKR
jgi:hypothetical protein